MRVVLNSNVFTCFAWLENTQFVHPPSLFPEFFMLDAAAPVYPATFADRNNSNGLSGDTAKPKRW